MTKHTPGPWDIKNKENEFIVVNVQRDRPDYMIAAIPNINKYTQNTANAQLIAAAPELLEALKDMMLGSELHPNGHKFWSKAVPSEEALQKARSAIAKAEGK